MRFVGIDGAEARRRHCRGAVLRQIGVLDEEPEGVVVAVPSLEGLQGPDAFGKRGAEVKGLKLAPSTVSQPFGEVIGTRAGWHLDAPRLLRCHGTSEAMLNLGVQGVLHRGAKLGQCIGDKPGNRLGQRGDRCDREVRLIALSKVSEGQRPCLAVIVRESGNTIDGLIHMCQGRRDVELMVR
ncbi:hypothetical protein GA0115252_124917 [Streptomyces sp. DfronAA-171]|nr:hypothetical protein GA0115252_124917 [Streptomyces sp. DfronAA-171]